MPEAVTSITDKQVAVTRAVYPNKRLADAIPSLSSSPSLFNTDET